MNRKKINWGLSIVVIATVVSFLWTKRDEVEEDNFKYGRSFNETRKLLGVPKIEENWVTQGNNEWWRRWRDPGRGINTTKPIHLSKTSNFDGDTLISEEDRFYYETDDSLAFRVIYKYRFDSATWECKLIKYRKEKYPPTVSWTLTLEQADSVLTKWGLRR
jgi:hypothetical protein